MLTIDDMPPEVRERFTPEELGTTALRWFQENWHFQDYTGLPKLTVSRSCACEDIPTDRTFRDAWEDTGTAVQPNMPKARVIWMDQIRKVRDQELEKLDVPFMKALETGDTVEQRRIAELKQTLRDIPQTFGLAKYRTPNTLKAAWPPELPRAGS